MHNVQHAHIYQLVYVHFTPPEKCQGFWTFCNITVTLAFCTVIHSLAFFSDMQAYRTLNFSLFRGKFEFVLSITKTEIGHKKIPILSIGTIKNPIFLFLQCVFVCLFINLICVFIIAYHCNAVYFIMLI